LHNTGHIRQTVIMKPKPQLFIRLTFKNLLVFVFFFFAMHELHEQAHIITGRLICGCWGKRDFNVWDVCSNCLEQHPAAILATFAGPVFTFIMLWLGRYLVKFGQSAQHQSLGLVLILGNMQFGRMYMAAVGSGDEQWGLRQVFLNHDHSNALLIKIIGFLAVLVICLPPLITAGKAIANKRKLLVFISFLIAPLILDTVVILILLNRILQKGVLNMVLMPGTPLLITLWFVFCLAVVAANFKVIAHFALKSS